MEETRDLCGAGNCVAQEIVWRRGLRGAGDCAAQGIAWRRELRGAGDCVARKLGINSQIGQKRSQWLQKKP